jgi:tetratricopeptide (TPR) repeat protein
VDYFQAVNPSQRVGPLGPLIADPVKTVRMAVARLLAPVDLASVPEEARARLTRLFEEYVATLGEHLDMPGSGVSLGLFYADRGDALRAEKAYRQALRVDAHFTAASLDLADLYRQLGREDDARRVLALALATEPTDPAAHYALGLQRARAKAYVEARRHLQRAHDLAPANVDYSYAYAIALYDGGAVARAIDVLESALAAQPGDARIVQALQAYRARRDAKGAKSGSPQ